MRRPEDGVSNSILPRLFLFIIQTGRLGINSGKMPRLSHILNNDYSMFKEYSVEVLIMIPLQWM